MVTDSPLISRSFVSVRLTSFFFFFNDTATTEIYTLSLHDALPIYHHLLPFFGKCHVAYIPSKKVIDRKSTRLNSSHVKISYAVFCLKKKNMKPIRSPVPASTPSTRRARSR